MSRLTFFAANDGSHGIELWRTNGAAAGTFMVADLNSGVNGSFPASFVNLNGIVYFDAVSASGHSELFSTNGTASGTQLVKDFGADTIVQVVSVNGALYLWNGSGLWRSDGTPGGTTQISTVNISSPLTPSGGNLFYFTANDPTNGLELWVSDGTAGGTHITKDINPGASGSSPTPVDAINNIAIFDATDATSTKLWRSDGTAAGTFVLVNNGLLQSNTVAVGNEIFFSGTEFSTPTLFKTDGSAAGTAIVLSGFASIGSSLAAVGSTVFFAASDGASAHGVELWSTDGTLNGTTMVKDIDPGTAGSSPSNLTAVGNELYFTANDGSHGTELWKSDGTSAGTMMVKDLAAGSTSSNPFDLQAINGAVYFYATVGGATELWRSDGTANGTINLTSSPTTVSTGSFSAPFGIGLDPPPADFNADGMSDLLFQNTDGTPTIWEMNGTTPTSMTPLFNPGTSWHVIGTGDFNGDSKADILFQNDNGEPAIWLMNGTTATLQTGLFDPGASWHIIGTGDFNGDGDSDILFQNTDGTPQ